jgi:hypothetical protein
MPNDLIPASDVDLLDAIKMSLTGASPKSVAKILKVSEAEVQKWILSPQWQKTKEQIWPQIRNAVHTELCSLRSQLARKLSDRIEHGDPVYDREGQVEYRELKARDLSSVLAQVNEVVNGLEKNKGEGEQHKKVDLDDLQSALRKLTQTEVRKEVSKQNAKVVPGERLN